MAVAQRVVAEGNFAKEDEAGDAAAQAVITAFENLLDAEQRDELLQLAVPKGVSVRRSASVFNNFGAHPTGLKHKGADKVLRWAQSCDGSVQGSARDSSSCIGTGE